MHRHLRTILAIASLALLVGSEPVWAVSIETQLTRTNLSQDHLVFAVNLKDGGDVKDAARLVAVEVTVRWSGRKPSPFLEGSLSVADADGVIAHCRVKEAQGESQVVYVFSVSRRFLSRSKFTFGEYAYAVRKDEKGEEKIQPMPAANFYWFYLKDFIAAQSVAQHPRDSEPVTHLQRHGAGDELQVPPPAK